MPCGIRNALADINRVEVSKIQGNCDHNYCNKFTAPSPIALQNKFGAIDQRKDEKWFKDNCVEGEDGSLLKEEPRQISADETRENKGWNNSICSLTPCFDPESKILKAKP